MHIYIYIRVRKKYFSSVDIVSTSLQNFEKYTLKDYSEVLKSMLSKL